MNSKIRDVLLKRARAYDPFLRNSFAIGGEDHDYRQCQPNVGSDVELDELIDADADEVRDECAA